MPDLKYATVHLSRVFGVDENFFLVGNGAAELINSLGHISKGKISVGLPTFNEYVRCFKNCEIIPIDNSKWDYQVNLEEYKYETNRKHQNLVIKTLL